MCILACLAGARLPLLRAQWTCVHALALALALALMASSPPRFSTHAAPGPAPTPTTRLRLEHAPSSTVALLSAMTCELGDLTFMAAARAKLGPDPLREDADGEQLWAKMRSSKRPVGQILMDQSCVAGVGNIYRAEILFKAGVHPETPGAAVSRERFEAIWRHSVLLLQAGFASGSIITVDPAEGLPAPWLRRYVYNQAMCGRCRGAVATWDMQARTVYCCETCQPQVGMMSPARAKAHGKAAPARLFQSHCAPDDAAEALPPAKMSVSQLREALAKHGLAVTGAKPLLLARLLAASAPDAAPRKLEAATLLAAPQPGTAHLGGFASAAAAAAEKLAAGESGAVEHVALADDATAALRAEANAKRPRAEADAKRPLAEADVDAAPGVVAFPQRKRR
jgi:hypothetical protein